jgi:DNA-binding CsgD family transcriptional regulator
MKPGTLTYTLEVVFDERDVKMMQLRSDGYSAQEIGAAVFLSPRTVEAHFDGLRKLLGAKSSYHLIKIAMKQGLIT